MYSDNEELLASIKKVKSTLFIEDFNILLYKTCCKGVGLDSTKKMNLVKDIK